MNIQTLAQPKKQKAKKGRKLSSEERFQKEWKRVVNAQKRNQRLQADVSALATEVSELIKADEQHYTSTAYQHTLHLIKFLSRKSLAQWQRDELCHWIAERIELLTYHPFNQHLDINALNMQFDELTLATPQPAPFDNDELASSNPESDNTESSDQANIDMIEKLFAEFAEANNKGPDDADPLGEDNFFKQFYEDAFQQENEYEQEHKRQAQTLDNVLKKSSLNKMFRKIAARLHPDREQDPSKKEQKHRQMSELIAARDNRDVLTLFSLYDTHVGEPIDQLLDTDHEHLITLLKHQQETLKKEREDVIDENPIAGMIYRRFQGGSKAKVQARVKQHIEQLQEDTQRIQAFLNSVTSLQKLKPHLEMRNQQHANSFLKDIMNHMGFAE